MSHELVINKNYVVLNTSSQTQGISVSLYGILLPTAIIGYAAGLQKCMTAYVSLPTFCLFLTGVQLTAASL